MATPLTLKSGVGSGTQVGGAITISPGNSAGNHQAGANLTLNAGQGTGTNTGGNIVFNVATQGAAAATTNALATALTIYQSKDAAFTGNLTVGATDANQVFNIASHDLNDGGLQLAGTLVTASAAELNLVDTSSAGTIVNSKAVIYGSGGEVNATTLQIGGTSITSTAAELNIVDGGTTVGTDAVSGSDGIVVNDATVMKQTSVDTFDTYFSATTKTLTNKTISMANNTLSGTLAHLNTAVSDATLVSTTGAETLTNKTLTTPQINTSIVPASADGADSSSTEKEWSDLYLADGSVIYFGNDQDVTLTHVADTGLALKHTATGDDKPIKLTLQTGETDIAINDIIGVIDFQAPDEGTGTDSRLVCAGIEAVSEGDFAANYNATTLSFKTAASETASEKMKLSSAGVLTVNNTIESGVSSSTG